MIRELDLDALVLKRGVHEENSNLEMSIMEAVSFVSGEPWSDHPECVCEALGDFFRSWNDSIDEVKLQHLKRYIVPLVGTNDGNSIQRSWMAFDWLTRVYTPEVMDENYDLRTHARLLKSLPKIDSAGALDAAKETIYAANYVSHEAASEFASLPWWEARDAAWNAATRCLREAGWDAFRYCARYAAFGSAWDAGQGATREASSAAFRATLSGATSEDAVVATRAKLSPLVSRLQESAFELLDRMLSVKKEETA